MLLDRESAQLQDLRRTGNRPNQISQLVTERAVKAAQTLLALIQPLLDQAEIVGQRRLLNESDRQKEAVRARQQLAPAAWLFYVIDHAREKREENAAEDLVLLEHLVFVESLREPELAQLHRLGDDGHFGQDHSLRILNVVGDSQYQKRHVIEKRVGGENAIGVERHPGADSIEPAVGQLVTARPHLVGECLGERAILEWKFYFRGGRFLYYSHSKPS